MGPRVVFDTNILISALLSPRGAPFRCLMLAKLGQCESITCREILEEFTRKLRVKFHYSSAQADTAASDVQALSSLVTISGTLHVVTRDPSDDKILECALRGRADYVVSGDRRHLLALGTYQNIVVITAGDLVARISQA